MGMSLRVFARQTVTNRFGKEIVVEKDFLTDVYGYTNSEETLRVLNSPNPVDEYFHIWNTMYMDEEHEICEDFDEQVSVDLGLLKWEDAKSKKIDVYNPGCDHAEAFRKWADSCVEEGYEILFQGV